MDFEHAHSVFISHHLSRRRGERARRLKTGHGHAEREFLKRIWWPAFRSFENLHPEYEIIDFDGRRRFLDFAYLHGQIKLAIEIDGFGTHAADIDRWQFINHLRRQNHLVLDGWSVLRFSYDEVKDEPRYCQRALQQFFGRTRALDPVDDLTLQERAVVQLALRNTASLTPKQIGDYLGVGRKATYTILKRLVEKEWLEPSGGQMRIRSYRLHPRRRQG